MDEDLEDLMDYEDEPKNQDNNNNNIQNSNNNDNSNDFYADFELKNRSVLPKDEEIKNSSIPSHIKDQCRKHCTTSIHGYAKIKQRPYYCNICLPNIPICNDCFSECHSKCSSKTKNDNEYMFFVCGCGQHLKHKCITKETESEIEEIKNKAEVIQKVLDDPNCINNYPQLETTYKEKSGRHFFIKENDDSLFRFPFDYKTYGSIAQHKNFLCFAFLYFVDEMSQAFLSGIKYISHSFIGGFFDTYFNFIKPLSIENFLSYSIGDLLYYKKNFPYQHYNSEEIYNKYISTKEVKSMIMLSSNCISVLIKNGFFTIDDYILYFRFVKKCGQYLLYDYESIKCVVDTLLLIYEKEKNVMLSVKFEPLPSSVFECLIMLAKGYDVLVLEEYLSLGEREHDQHNHIFYDNEFGNNLFLLMFKVLHLYKYSNYENKSKFIENFSILFKHFSNIFFFPFQTYKENFKFLEYGSTTINVFKPKDTTFIDFVKKCNEEIYQLKISFRREEKYINTIVNDFKEKLLERIVWTDECTYRNYQHFKISKKVKEFFGKNEKGEYIKNIDEIINEMTYANVETTLVMLLYDGNQEKIGSIKEAIVNILMLYFLTEKGIKAICQGEIPKFLNKKAELQSIALLLPKSKVNIEEIKIVPGSVNDIKIIKKKCINTDFQKDAFQNIVKVYYSLFENENTFYDLISKSNRNPRERENYKKMFAVYDIISTYSNTFRKEFLTNYSNLFSLFDHPELINIFNLPSLSIKKKCILIKTFSLVLLGPVFDDNGYLKKPLSNADYGALKHYDAIEEGSTLINNRNIISDEDLAEPEGLYSKVKDKLLNSVKHFHQIKMLMTIVTNELNKIPSSYNTNTKEYFEYKKISKVLIRTLTVLSLYLYSFDNIIHTIMAPLLELTATFLEKEMIILKILGVEEDSNDGSFLAEMQKETFDFFNKKQVIKVLIKELYKFYPKIKPKIIKSLYSLYIENNENIFIENDTPFTFLTGINETKNDTIYKNSEFYTNIPNFGQYRKWTLNQIEDTSNYVYANLFNANEKINLIDFRELFTKELFFEYFIKDKSISNTITTINVLYSISCYNKDWIIQQFENNSREVKLEFFNSVRNILFYFMKSAYGLARCFPNQTKEINYSYITVSLIKFLEMFGEGYNFKFHEYILVERGENKPMDFDLTSAEIEKRDKENSDKQNEEWKRQRLLIERRRQLRRNGKDSLAVFVKVNEEVNNAKEEVIKNEKEDEALDGKSYHSDSSEVFNDEDDEECKFEIVPDDKKTNLRQKKQFTIFEDVIIMLDKSIKELIRRDKYDFVNPYDENLFIVVSAEIDFLIEFFYTLNKEHEELIDIGMIWLIKYNLLPSKFGLSLFSLLVNEEHKVLNEKELFLKGRILDLVNSYLSSGNKQKIIELLLNSKIAQMSTMGYYKQILFYFNLLLHELQKDTFNKLYRIESEEEYSEQLVQLYLWDKKFRDSWQIKLIMKYSKFIFLLETRYRINDIPESFKNNTFDDWEVKTKGLYKFLKSICIPIELEYVVSQNEKEYIRLNEVENEEHVEENIISSENNQIKKYKKIRSRILKPEQPIDSFIHEKFERTFFIVPYYSFFLSNQSKLRFIDNVDRSTKTTKATSLINSIESFLFEMLVNKFLFMKSSFSQVNTTINYKTFEVINFAFICLHNLILLYHYYKNRTLDEIAYETYEDNKFNNLFDTSNWIFALVQIVFLICVIGIWYKFNFLVCYFNNLQLTCDTKTPLQERIKQFRKINQTENPNFNQLLNEHFKNVPTMTKTKIAVIDSLLINQEICFLIYTLILLILYLVFQSPIFVVFPMLFMAHLFGTLSAVFSGIYSRFGTLSAVYIFTFLVIYIFMWTGFLFFGHLFTVDTITSNNDTIASEPFCSSSIQCLLFFFNYGIRSGGGIGDLLGTPSFKDNYIFFMILFFYEIAFHLVIVMIFANVFLGLIADAFGELREVAWTKDNDMKNICFICQIDTDTCAVKGIDFEEHVQVKHNIWNYVYFLCYLYMKDENEYNIMEYKIMSSINEMNLSWLPFAGDGEDEE